MKKNTVKKLVIALLCVGVVAALTLSVTAVVTRNNAKELGALLAREQAAADDGDIVAYYKDEPIRQSTIDSMKQANALVTDYLKEVSGAEDDGTVAPFAMPAADNQDADLLQDILTEVMLLDEAKAQGLSVAASTIDAVVQEQKKLLAQSPAFAQFITDYCAGAQMTEAEYWALYTEAMSNNLLMKELKQSFIEQLMAEKGWQAESLTPEQSDELDAAFDDYVDALYVAHADDIRILKDK